MMAELPGGLRVDEGRYFGELNFHPVQLLDELRDWLIDPAGLPLVMQGEIGSGREYCLKAACRNRDLHGLPWKVVSIDWQHQGCRTLGELVHSLAEQQEVGKNKIDWLAEIARSFDLEKNPAADAFLPLTLVINLASTLDLARKLFAAWSTPTVSLPGDDPFTALRRLLETLLNECNLILHIRNADLLDLGTTGDLLDICSTLDRDAEKKYRQGRLLLALSCSPELRPVELLPRRRDRICIVQVEPLTEQELRRSLDRNFSPNTIDDALVTLLHWYGRAEAHDRHCFPSEIAKAMNELLNKNMLIQQDDCWIRNPKTREEEVNTAIGKPLRDLYRERLNAIDGELRAQAERFMELAALCRQWIPQQLLLEYMGLDEEQGNDLIDSLDTAFVDTEPQLLIDEQYRYPGFSELAVYRFAVPLLAVSLLPKGRVKEEAEKLLAFLDLKLPSNKQSSAALCWQLAELAGPKAQKKWREGMIWCVAPEQADRFSDMLLAKLHAGLVSVDYLLKKANSEREKQSSAHLFRSVILACERWYQEQGGVPSNREGADFLSLYGELLDDLGQYEEALEKGEEALKIYYRVLPADHRNIATSLHNIGVFLYELGLYQEALEKEEEALKIWYCVLPANHPHVATGLNNIGAALNDLGQYEEALEKLEAALTIRQRVLPADHPDIAGGINAIGLTLSYLGRYEEALEKYEVALEIRQRVLPADHPYIATSLNNIGAALNDLGQYEEALEKLEAALTIRQRVLPADHPDIAGNLSGIGYTLSDLGRHDEAIEKHRTALDIRERSLPAGHLCIGNSLNGIGYALNNAGRYEQALINLQEALEIRQSVFSTEHPLIAITLRNIGNSLTGLGQYEEALKNYQAALDIQQRMLPAEHPDITKTHDLIQTCREKLAKDKYTEQ